MIEVNLEGRVLRVQMNRPERRNALTLAMCQSLVRALEQANEDAAVGCILLTGDGPAFCSGMDLEDALEVDQDLLGQVHDRLFTAITWLRKPMLAAVQGPAIAGGAGLAANAHIVIAAHTAKFGLTEIKVGLWPVAIYRAIVLAVGHRRAAAWSISGQVFTAQQALAANLVTELAKDALAEALKQARDIAAYSPQVLSAGLDYAEEVREKSWVDTGQSGQALRKRLTAHPDFAEGVAAFQQKRQPEWPSLSGRPGR